LYEGPGNSQHVWVKENRIKKLVKGTTILDCGCGKGGWGVLLGKNHVIVGVDILRKYLEEAKPLRVYDNLVQADLAYLPFKPHSFDTVLAVEVIEHLPEEEGVRFLKQIRLLGKRMVLTTPKEFVPVDFGKDHPETHRSYWTKEQIESILA
jgi:ubiquinone/menaquinone biosynthesis C-methylase UbiE